MDVDTTGLVTAATARELIVATESPDAESLARAALVIARIEHRDLRPQPYLDQMRALGERANGLVPHAETASVEARIEAFNACFYDDYGFHGNDAIYYDPRNSFVNDVIDRRTGIPISLAVVYMEVARHAGLAFDGVNFPGHFLIRLRESRFADQGVDQHVLDPFNRGAVLSSAECRRLLRRHAGEDAVLEDRLLVAASKRAILTRMLVNLKRLYVKMRSFPQARAATNLLLAVDPSALAELRDRGLLAYHMNDFASALRDLERYLEGTPLEIAGSPEERADHAQVWEHVKTLRRRLASFN